MKGYINIKNKITQKLAGQTWKVKKANLIRENSPNTAILCME